MKRIDSSLITPIYVKQHDQEPLPDDPVYYLLASSDLYLCRKHAFYRSCVPAPQWPTELGSHAASLVPNFPTIPQDQFEQICGFFSTMSDRCGAEAIALLAWDDGEQRVRTIVPRQISAVCQSGYSGFYPIGVKYKFPSDLPQDWTVFCDIHSHCEMAAYASQTDVDDEDTFTGLHLVVGRLHQEPPEFHAEGVVDGTRFVLDWQDLVAGYEHRAVFPTEWLDLVTITNYSTFKEFEFAAQELESPTPSNGEPFGKNSSGHGPMEPH